LTSKKILLTIKVGRFAISSDFSLEKAKPTVRRGRKATGLLLGDGRVAFENEHRISKSTLHHSRFAARLSLSSFRLSIPFHRSLPKSTLSMAFREHLSESLIDLETGIPIFRRSEKAIFSAILENALIS